MSNIHNSAIMSSGNRKWKSFEDIADWSSAMIPRLIKSFGLDIGFDLTYKMTDDLEPGVLGSFSLKTDEENNEFHGVVQIVPDLIAKKDILAVLLHELIHAHCITVYLRKFINKEMTKEEFEKNLNDPHEGLFGQTCRAVGFGSDMTATKAKPALVRRLLALDFE